MILHQLNPDYQIDLEITDALGKDIAASFPEARLLEAVRWVLTRHRIAVGAGVTLVVTTNEEVQALNRQFRGVDAPTDVLSFPADPLPEEILDAIDDAEIEGDFGENYLGDLIMAYPYTLHQALETGHDPDDEFVLLAAHGTLHLLGFDHDTPETQQAMWAAQAEALAALGVSIEVPLFSFDDFAAYTEADNGDPD
jgi:probable rRNA maturation factor